MIFLPCSMVLVAMALTPVVDDSEEAIQKFEAQYSDSVKEVRETLVTLHKALTKYTEDHEGEWIQVPEDLSQDAESFAEWLAETLEPYGMPRDAWVHSAEPEKDKVKLSYFPTMFGPGKRVAYRWASQPWVVMRGKIFPQFPKVTYLLMPDGSILVIPFNQDTVFW